MTTRRDYWLDAHRWLHTSMGCPDLVPPADLCPRGTQLVRVTLCPRCARRSPARTHRPDESGGASAVHGSAADAPARLRPDASPASALHGPSYATSPAGTGLRPSAGRLCHA